MTEKQLRELVVATAQGFLGAKQGDARHKKIIDIYNADKPLPRGYTMTYIDPWCACTISTVSIMSRLTDILPKEVSCGRMIDLYKKLGRWQENDALVPLPGDILFYDWDDDGKGDCTGAPEHVGIVVSVSGSTIKVIEGNISKAVGYRNIQVNGRYIRGYGLPDYAGKASRMGTPSSVPDKAAVVTAIKQLQTAMKTVGFYMGSLDGSFGPLTEKAIQMHMVRPIGMRDGKVTLAIKAVQTVLKGLGYYTGEIDGSFGPLSFAAVQAYNRVAWG